MTPEDLAGLIRHSSTVGSIVAVCLSPFVGARRMLLVQIILFPLANVYIAGVSFAVTTAVMYLELFWRSHRLHIPWFYLVLWLGWLTANVARTAVAGSLRELYQLAEFAFYGVLLLLLIPVLSISRDGYQQVLVALSTGGAVLGGFFYFSGGINSPVATQVIGPNEGSFILVIFGVVSPIILGMGRLRLLPVVLAVVTVSFLGILKMESRGALVVSMAIVSMAVLLAIVRRRVLLSFCLGIVVLISGSSFLMMNFRDQIEWRIAHPTPSDQERLALMRGSMRLYQEHPLFGWGWGSGDQLFPNLPETERSYPHPHNSYAHFAVEMGSAGLLFLGLLYARLLFLAIRADLQGYRPQAAVPLLVALTLSMASMVEVIFYGANRAIVAILAIALAEAAVSHLRLGGARRVGDGEMMRE